MATLVISYARVDQPLVRGVVKLLRAAMTEIEDAVYWDDDFAPGAAWSEQIRRSIDEAPQLFVFWCAHSATSPQVLEELTYALNAGKIIVPVLLDDTRLNEPLTAIHGVDLRTAVRHAAARRWLRRPVVTGSVPRWSAQPTAHVAARWLVPAAIATTVLALSVFAWRALRNGDVGAPAEYVVEAQATPPMAAEGIAERDGRQPEPPTIGEPHAVPVDPRLEQARLRHERLREDLMQEIRFQATLKEAAPSRRPAPGPASDADGSDRAQRPEADAHTPPPIMAPPPSAGLKEELQEELRRQASLREAHRWVPPPINEGMPESLMRALQLRESRLREAQLRRLWRQQQAERERLERSVGSHVPPPPTGAAANPAATTASAPPGPTEAPAQSAVPDHRPRALPIALLLALAGLIATVVWRRRRSKHARSQAREATARDAEGGEPVLAIDQPAQDALVEQFRHYLHPTRS